MKRFRNGLAIAMAVLLVACQGGMSNGTSTPGGAVLPPGPAGPTTAPAAAASANPQSAAGAAGSGTYPFSLAAAGLQCPTDQGFSCTFKFNIPPATATPEPTPTPTASPKSKTSGKSKGHDKGKEGKKHASLSSSKRATPSPSPSPSASPSPNASSSPSGSAAPAGSTAPGGSPAPGTSGSPAASPTPAGPTITIKVQALPKDAPAMTNPDPKAVATTPLLAVRVTVDADVTLDGAASADFTLPAEQVGGRGFAIQLFEETQRKHKKVSDSYLGSYAQSTLNGNTLHFAFTPPTVTVKKGETWLFVLYGDERPSVTAAPSPSGAPSTPPSTAPQSPAPSPAATSQP